MADRIVLRRSSSPDLSADEIAVLRALLWAAFKDDGDGFTEADWEHAQGGTHFILERDGSVAAHASVVARTLRIGERTLRTGYVEAVATAPNLQARGFGSLVIADATAWIMDRFELGALSTGRHSFYERLGWQTWAGPSFVATADGLERTPDDDGDILVLLTPISPELDSTASIICEWRTGDVW